MGHIFVNNISTFMDSGETVDVLAIGDSWFHYVANNLINPLYEALERPTIYVLGKNGARADELCKDFWLKSFRQFLSDYPNMRLVCISAGGNDFAGVGDLDAKILQPDCSTATKVDDCWQAGEPKLVFDAVEDGYKILLAAVNELHPGLPVLVHNYDYAIPDGHAFPGLHSWLKLPMDNCRVPTAGAPLGGIRRDVVRALIDQFTLSLDDLLDWAKANNQPAVELVWSAGTLGDSDWANELHPRPRGFNRIVAQCWRTPARKALGLPT